MFTCKMGTIILTLSISERIELYKVSTSVREFLACISFLLLFLVVLFPIDPLSPQLCFPSKPHLKVLCSQRSHFFNLSSSSTLSRLHVSFFPLQMNYLPNVCVVPIAFAPTVHTSLCSLPGASPTQAQPLRLLL